MWWQKYRGSEEEIGCVVTSLRTFSRSDTLVTSHEKTKEGSVRLMEKNPEHLSDSDSPDSTQNSQYLLSAQDTI